LKQEDQPLEQERASAVALETTSKASGENSPRKTTKKGKRYRLLFMNEREDKVLFSMRLYTWVAALLFTLLIALTAVLVVLIMTRTPLKSFLPGYLDMNKKTELVEATLRLDSLEHASRMRTVYLQNLTDILSGRVKVDSIVPFSSAEAVRFNDSLREASDREQAFVSGFEEQERYSLNALTAQAAPASVSFIAPVKGSVLPADSTSRVQAAKNGARPVNELRVVPVRPYTVLAPADGMVVAVNEDIDGYYSVMIQHVNDCLSELNHLTSVWVSVGQSVRAGSAVAQADPQGDEPSWVGIRIWQRGTSVDPQFMIN
jgi:lipoprotein NlpD